MADLIDRKSVIDVIHKAIFDFFDIVDDDDESPMTYKDEQLLTLNKAIVTKIKALPSAQPDVPDTNVGDMISRRAAIDTVRSYYDECDEREESIEERLEQLPSADIDLSSFSDKLWVAAYERGKAEAVRWIPVSEQLPEDEQEVLFSTKTGRVHLGRYHNDNSVNQWYSTLDKMRAWNNVVNAWMPLPEPYKDGEHDG